MNYYGKVFLIGVPIGNYKDITFRALESLKEVSLLLCEDTRETKKLLDDFLINKDLISYVGSHDFALKKSLELLKNGESVGIVSDRGMPCVSDPGADLVKFFQFLQVDIKVIPGVSSVTSAFVLTGLKGSFYFAGFLPKKESAIIKEVTNLLSLSTNLIFFESPYRIKKTLASLAKILDREIFILRELTKTYEEILIGTPTELLEKNIQGEIVIIIGSM